MDERRVVARQRTYLKGLLAFNKGNSSEDCLVRNLTETGALLELPHPHVPATFDLIISARGVHRHARVVWRNGGRFGVELAPSQSVRRAAQVH